MRTLIFILCFSAATLSGYCQFDVNGQLVQRAEFRNGYGTLLTKDTTPSFFIGNRTRIQFSYKSKNFILYSSIQDVRTFGNTSQLKSSDSFLSLHEGWGEIKLDTLWSVKIGRQELVYDNSRFLGNADWLLQGRAHDFVLLKYETNNFKLNAGGGYNQDGEKLYGNTFTVANQYKTAQLFRLEFNSKIFHFSILGWNDGRQYTIKDSTGKIIEEGVRYMQTYGSPNLKLTFRNTSVSAFYYHQSGKDVKGKTVYAFDASVQISQLINFNEKKNRQFRITLGGEALSGTDKSNPTKNESFSPLYGTNHYLNGYMDYFYVGGRHENSVGLIDAFLRSKFDLSKNLFLSINGHYFLSYADVIDNANKGLDKYLGTELDFSAGIIPSEFLSIQAGYSQIFSSSTLHFLRNSWSPLKIQNWAYLMVIFRPKSTKMFIGLGS